MDGADLAFVDDAAPFGESGDEVASDERRPLAPKPEEPNALASPEAAGGAGGSTSGDARIMPGAPGSAAAAATGAGAAGMKRAMTASAAGHLQQQNQRLRPSSSLLAKKDAAIAAVAQPETSGKAARPTASAGAGAPAPAPASSLGRRSSGSLLAGRSGSLSRLKTKAGAPGMRVLLPGQGARDYASLLKGSATLRGRELEERVATAEAEVGRGICWGYVCGDTSVAIFLVAFPLRALFPPAMRNFSLQETSGIRPDKAFARSVDLIYYCDFN